MTLAITQGLLWSDYATLVLTAIAIVVNFRAARRAFLDAKPRLYATTFLAAFYFVAFSVLVFSGISPINWNHYVRGVGPIVWLVVWIWPAINVDRLVRRSNERLTSREGYEDDP